MYKNLPFHLENQCSFTYKTCSNIGCNYSALKGYYSHDSCDYEQVNDEFVSLQNKNKTLNDKFVSLQSENKTLNDTVNLLKNENETLNDKFVSLKNENTLLNFNIKKWEALDSDELPVFVMFDNKNITYTEFYSKYIKSFYNIRIVDTDVVSPYELLKNKQNDIIIKRIEENDNEKKGDITLHMFESGKYNIVDNIQLTCYGYYLYIFTDTPFSYKKDKLNYDDISYKIINKDDFLEKYIFNFFDIDELIMFIKLYYANPSIKRQDILFFDTFETTKRDAELLEENKELIDEFDKKKVDWYIYILIKNSTGMTDFVRNKLEKYNFIKFI